MHNSSQLHQGAPLKRLSNIQALRGLAAFGVLLSHLYIIEQKYSQDHILSELLNFGMAGVDIFFVISGFIMVYVTHKWQTSAARQVPEFIFARASRIYPLYWFVSTALLMVYIIKPQWVFSASAGNDPDILKSFLLWPNIATYPLLEVGWTLIHEMSFYLVFALILIASRRFRPILIELWAALVVIGALLGWSHINAVTSILFHPLSLEFCAGAALGYWLLNRNNNIQGLPILIAAVILFISAVMYHLMTSQTTPGLGWNRVLSFGIAASVLLLAAFIFEQKGKTAPRWSVTLGDWSYALYLTHVLTLSAMGRIWALCDQPELWDNFIVLPLLVIGSIIVAGLTHKTIEAPMMRASKSIQDKLFKRA